MNEFTSGFWSAYIAVLTIVSILACGVLLWKLSTKRLAPGQKAGVMGHVWDENLQEYNNPLPRWWMWLFWLTLVFGVVYLVLYPGLGSFAGVLMLPPARRQRRGPPAPALLRWRPVRRTRPGRRL